MQVHLMFLTRAGITRDSNTGTSTEIEETEHE